MKNADALHLALNSPDPVERQKAVRIAATLPTGNGVAVLCQLAATDESGLVRLASEEAFDAVPNRDVIPALHALLRYPDARFRLVVVRQLGVRGGIESVPGLGRALHDRDADVSRAAAWALERIGGSTSAQELYHFLVAAPPGHRTALFEALGRVKDPAIIPRLLPGLQVNDETTRTEMARTLGRIGNAAAVPGLCEAAGDPSPRVRGAAVGALRNIADVAARPTLCAAAGDPDKGVRNNALEALAHLGWQESLEDLTTALASDSPHLQAGAARRLGERGDPEAASVLCAALGEETPEVRIQAQHALVRLDRVESLERLLKAMESRHWRLRACAIRRVGRRQETSAIPQLRRALRYSHREVVAAAVEALGRVGGVEAVGDLTDLLFHADSLIRLSSAKALGEIGSRHALLELKQRLRTFGGEPDRGVRQALRESVRAIESATSAHADIPVVAARPHHPAGELPLPAAGDNPDWCAHPIAAAAKDEG